MSRLRLAPAVLACALLPIAFASACSSEEGHVEIEVRASTLPLGVRAVTRSLSFVFSGAALPVAFTSERVLDGTLSAVELVWFVPSGGTRGLIKCSVFANNPDAIVVGSGSGSVDYQGSTVGLAITLDDRGSPLDLGPSPDLM